MDATQKIPPYHERAQHKRSGRDVTVEEIHRQNKKLNSDKRKNRKLKAECVAQKARRKQAERCLEQERRETAQGELRIRIQTKLDDHAFYCGDA